MWNRYEALSRGPAALADLRHRHDLLGGVSSMGEEESMSRSEQERRWIKEANRRMERAGKRSRYVDAKPDHDWTLDGDEQLADRVNPLEDIPPEVLAKGEVMRRQTLAEIEERGITPGRSSRSDVHADMSPLKRRIENVKKFITYFRDQGMESKAQEYEAELKELTHEE